MTNDFFQSIVDVGVRLRPVLSTDDPPSDETVDIISPGRVTVEGRVFDFTFTVTPSVEQNNLYMAIAHPLLEMFFQGYNVSIVALGQSGAGKTYTMLGPDSSHLVEECDLGLIPRSISSIFARIDANSAQSDIVFSSMLDVSYMEVSDTCIRDLLAYDTAFIQSPYSVQECLSIDGLTKVSCKSAHDVFSCLHVGTSARSVPHTHTFFMLYLQQQIRDQDHVIRTIYSTICFVELAGSQLFPSPNDADDFTMDSGLLAIKSMIHKEVSPNFHSLSLLMKDIFGGNCRTITLCCISPSDTDESLNSLTFASDLLRVCNHLQPNISEISAVDGAGVTNSSPVTCPPARLVNPVPPFSHSLPHPPPHPLPHPPLSTCRQPPPDNGLHRGDCAPVYEQLIGDLCRRVHALESRDQPQAGPGWSRDTAAAVSAVASGGTDRELCAADNTQQTQLGGLTEKRMATFAPGESSNIDGDQLFQLQFALLQYYKLVRSAETLLTSVVAQSGSSVAAHRQMALDWICRKHECDECVSAHVRHMFTAMFGAAYSEAPDPLHGCDRLSAHDSFFSKHEDYLQSNDACDIQSSLTSHSVTKSLISRSRRLACGERTLREELDNGLDLSLVYDHQSASMCGGDGREIANSVAKFETVAVKTESTAERKILDRKQDKIYTTQTGEQNNDQYINEVKICDVDLIKPKSSFQMLLDALRLKKEAFIKHKCHIRTNAVSDTCDLRQDESRMMITLDECVVCLDDLFEYCSSAATDCVGRQLFDEKAMAGAGCFTEVLHLTQNSAHFRYLLFRIFARIVDLRLDGMEKDLLLSESDLQNVELRHKLCRLNKMVAQLMADRVHYKQQRDVLRRHLQSEGDAEGRSLRHAGTSQAVDLSTFDRWSRAKLGQLCHEDGVFDDPHGQGRNHAIAVPVRHGHNNVTPHTASKIERALQSRMARTTLVARGNGCHDNSCHDNGADSCHLVTRVSALNSAHHHRRHRLVIQSTTFNNTAVS